MCVCVFVCDGDTLGFDKVSGKGQRRVFYRDVIGEVWFHLEQKGWKGCVGSSPSQTGLSAKTRLLGRIFSYMPTQTVRLHHSGRKVTHLKDEA